MAHSATHNPCRSPRPARAGFGTVRIVLALLVGLALTSICQGHNTGEHRLAPHLAILSETGGHAEEQPYAPPHTGTDPGPMYTISAPGTPDAHEVASLGAALPLLALLGFPASRRWPRPHDARSHAATPLQPEPPPPRQV
jgi:hypothetical protein